MMNGWQRAAIPRHTSTSGYTDAKFPILGRVPGDEFHYDERPR